MGVCVCLSLRWCCGGPAKSAHRREEYKWERGRGEEKRGGEGREKGGGREGEMKGEREGGREGGSILHLDQRK